MAVLSLLLFLLAPVSALAECRDGTLRIERAMQDGLSDMTRAERLRGEALHNSNAARATPVEICAFLRESDDHFGKALAQYRECSRLLTVVLESCPGQDWSRLSASPEICEAQSLDIESQHVSLQDDIAIYCRP